MPTAAIYARVSSDRQKADQTIASQTAALREYASSMGLVVPAEWVFEDEGVSGATLVRPALERLRDLAAQVHVEVVLCYSPDRLARKYAYQALLIEEFGRVGTEVRFVKGPRAQTPEDELLLQFQGMIAEYEKAQIAERTRRGKAHRAKAGSVNVLSGAPYGYSYVRKSDEAQARYEIVEHQAAVVQEIFRLYIEENVSIGVLARRLSEQGIPTASHKPVWDRSTVWGMLRNPAYCGRAAFSKTMRTQEPVRVTRRLRLRGEKAARRPARRERPRDQWIEVVVPAIISEEMFELAARRLEDNRHFAARGTKEPSLLQGILVCRSCGYAYYRTSTRTSLRKLYYYRCLGSDDYRWKQGRRCSNPPVRQDYLDELVWQHVTALISDPALAGMELERRLQEIRSSSPARTQKARLELELNKIMTAMNRLVVAYQEELLSLDELRRRMPELRRKETSLRADVEALEARLVDQDTYLKLAENLEGFLARLRNAALHSSVEERQRVLRLIVREVLVDSERVVVRHSIPSLTSGGTPGYLLCGRSPQPAAG
ncbi:MAG TPA: recombinase family protein [Thermoanaerobaculia bacterium]|nr:recombinase family protein [Thermoanaerobaculia bacterium]